MTSTVERSRTYHSGTIWEIESVIFTLICHSQSCVAVTTVPLCASTSESLYRTTV